MDILLADDSSLLRQTLRKLLTSLAGVDHIYESYSVLSTINQIEVEKPDVVILDVQLPDGTGMDVLKFIITKEPKPLTIILTNHASKSNERCCKQYGADYYFDKTEEFEKMLRILEQHKEH